MADKHILHMITPLKHISPFDVNMAVDAGFDAVLPYTGVTLEELPGLVQDAIFSRPPKLGVKTGMFIGGKNAILALDMLSAAKKALVPPFGLSLFADPAGSFTTAAAMVACVEKILRDKKHRDLRGLNVAVFGATGVVGFCAAVIAALEGSASTSQPQTEARMPKRSRFFGLRRSRCVPAAPAFESCRRSNSRPPISS
jgi:methylene-tetrahydromethanopterin dehydrogenase